MFPPYTPQFPQKIPPFVIKIVPGSPANLSLSINSTTIIMKIRFSTFFILLAFLIADHHLQAQGCFRNTFSPFTTDLEIGTDILQAPNGDIMVLGHFRSGSDLGREVSLTRTDLAGNPVWSQRLGTDAVGASGSSDDEGVSMVNSWDGDGFIVLAEVSNGGNHPFSMLLFKVDGNGVPQWERNISCNGSIIPEKLIRTQDGNYLAVSSISASTTNSREFHAFKFTENGSTIFQTTVGGAETDDVKSVVELPDSSFFLCGTKGVFSSDEDMYFVHIGNNGAFLNAFTLGGQSGIDESAVDLDLSISGNVMVVGTRRTSSGETDIIMARVNIGGSALARRYGVAGEQDFPSDIILLPSGGYMVAGSTEGPPNGSSATFDGFLMRTNANGRTLGTNTYGSIEGSERLRSVIRTSTGEFAMYGSTDDSNAVGNMDHFYVVTNNLGQSGCCDRGPFGVQNSYSMDSTVYGSEKNVILDIDSVLFADSLGEIIPICPVSSKNSLSSELGQVADEMILYPNPSIGQVNLRIPEAMLGGKVLVMNNLGQVVVEQLVDQTETAFDLKGHTRGVYLVQLQNGVQQVTKKLILR